MLVRTAKHSHNVVCMYVISAGQSFDNTGAAADDNNNNINDNEHISRTPICVKHAQLC